MIKVALLFREWKESKRPIVLFTAFSWMHMKRCCIKDARTYMGIIPSRYSRHILGADTPVSSLYSSLFLPTAPRFSLWGSLPNFIVSMRIIVLPGAQRSADPFSPSSYLACSSVTVVATQWAHDTVGQRDEIHGLLGCRYLISCHGGNVRPGT